MTIMMTKPLENLCTQGLADFAAGMTFDALPAAAVHASKRLVLDTLACIVGATRAEPRTILAGVVGAQGGVGEATVLGTGERLPASRSGYINAYAANLLDADDTLNYKGHIAAAAVPGAFAMAERQHASGRDFIAALATGYDVASRIGMSLQGFTRDGNGEIRFAKVTGYSWCAFSASVAAAHLLGLDSTRMRSTLGITGVTTPLPSATQHSERTGRAMTKYAMYGTMVEAGINAALLAEAGFSGLPAILDGEKGLWGALGSVGCNFDAMLEALGSRWFIEEPCFKIYPACRFTNAATDMYYRIAREQNLKPGDIERIDVGLIAPAVEKLQIGNTDYQSYVDGQFCIAYELAVAALGVVPGPQWHAPETRARADVKAFTAKVHTAIEPSASSAMAEDIAQYGHARRLPASIRITAKGRTFEGRAEYATGDSFTPETTLSDADLENKFRSFSQTVLSAGQIDEAIGLVWALDSQPDLKPLVAALVAA